MVRLKKRDGERLLAEYDADPVGALTTALRITLDMPDATWPMLGAAAPIDDVKRQRLLSADQSSLDQLVTDLNEFRSFT